MILTRSPFYYNVTFNEFTTLVDFELSVGRGSTSSTTEIKNYSFTKAIPTNQTLNTWIDISPYIQESYNHTSIDLSGISANVVRESSIDSVLIASITAEKKDSIGNNQAPTSHKYIAVDGYSSYLEGQNLQRTNKILLSHDEYKADYRGYFLVPLRVASGDSNPTVNGTAVPLSFTDNNRNYIKYLVIFMADYDSLITVAFGGETITVEPIEECKYEVNEIQFLNKFGVIELMHTYKVKKETINIESEKFKNNYTNGVSYDTKKHQLKRYNVGGNKKINVETGFLNEEYNATIEQLLMSGYVWINGIPVNVDSSSLDFKTRIVDKLISYSLDFEYAFDEINNV